MSSETANRKQEVLKEICGAVSVLHKKKLGLQFAADCFCGTNKTVTTFGWHFQFDNDVLDLVKEAFAEKLGLTLEEFNQEMEKNK